jgi:hypothetical protein
MTGYTAAIRTVYFVRPVGELGPVKIGCSANVERRRAQLQTEADKRLEIVAAAPGSMDDERRIHSLFWHDHIRREWFNWSPILQLLIDAVARGEADWAALPPTRIRRMPGKRRPWTEEQKQSVRDRRASHGRAA